MGQALSSEGSAVVGTVVVVGGGGVVVVAAVVVVVVVGGGGFVVVVGKLVIIVPSLVSTFSTPEQECFQIKISNGKVLFQRVISRAKFPPREMELRSLTRVVKEALKPTSLPLESLANVTYIWLPPVVISSGICASLQNLPRKLRK